MVLFLIIAFLICMNVAVFVPNSYTRIFGKEQSQNKSRYSAKNRFNTANSEIFVNTPLLDGSKKISAPLRNKTLKVGFGNLLNPHKEQIFGDNSEELISEEISSDDISISQSHIIQDFTPITNFEIEESNEDTFNPSVAEVLMNIGNTKNCNPILKELADF